MAATYTDVPTLRRWLNKTGTQDDDLLGPLLEQAEQMAHRYTGRYFGPTVTETRTFSTHGMLRLCIPDVRSVTAVSLNGALLSSDWYALDYGQAGEPANSIQLYQWAWANVFMSTPFGLNDLRITGTWGWSPVPADVVGAVYFLAARMWKEKEAAYSDAVQTEFGVLSYFRQLPLRVQAVFDSFRSSHVALV